MTLAQAYYNLRRKVVGDIHGEGKSPWYTRWFWWVLILGVGLVVFAIWYFAKKREAQYRAAARTAEKKAEKARLEALAERDQEKARDLREKALQADKHANEVLEKVEKTAKKRQELEASIEGAKSWEELEEIERKLP